jgi:mercuric ion transport protein
MRVYLDKLGSFGSIITASACPACFPQLAALGTLVGLGALSSYEGQIFLATKILVALAIFGHVLAYFTHRLVWLVVLGAGGGILFFLGMYVLGSEAVVYLGFVAMFVASVTDLVRRLRMRRRLKLNANPE